ncbi:MAG: response regulator [Desulfobacterales bacterium]|nr:response regulator [Desulfobacterales bacterium]
MLISFIIFVAVLFQVLAAIKAIQLIKITKHLVSWLFISTAIFMMVIRRIISLFEIIEGYQVSQVFTESIGLLISLLMFIGIIKIVPFFISIKKAETDLNNANIYNRTLFEINTDPLFITDSYGKIKDLNVAAEESTGYSKSDIIGSDVFEYFKESNNMRSVFDYALKNGHIQNKELSIKNKNGEVMPVLLSASTYKPDSITGVFLAARNISVRKLEEAKRKKAEEKMLQTQKFESLGIMAGGVAHDFNNLLQIMLGFSDLILANAPPNSSINKWTAEIMKAGQRASKLTNSMLAYVGKGKFVFEKMNLSQVTEEMKQLIESSISKKVDLEYNLNTDIPLIKVDPVQIEQIIMNLVINASESLNDNNGKVAIETGSMHASESFLKDTYIDDNLSSGLYAYIQVSDTGCGMSKETIEKIFDPFFTTKFTGRGLGLPVMLGIVRIHKGAIEVKSKINEGSIFRVLFPAVEHESTQKEKHDKPIFQKINKKTILIIDDEESILSLAEEILKENGYEAIIADEAAKGIEILAKNKDKVDIVILDFTMPKMNGCEALKELKQVKNNIKIILSSGYNKDDIAKKIDLQELTGFLHKPYTSEELINELYKAI